MDRKKNLYQNHSITSKLSETGQTIILHAGWKGDGFLKQIWFLEYKLLLNCPPKSVIVLDNAKYHNAVVEKKPTKSSKRADMINWLRRHAIPHEPKMLKTELFTLIKTSNPVAVYQTDILAQKFGHDCLRLPWDIVS